MAAITTIGYEGASMPHFLAALRRAGVELLVDVRAVASSRRPGFAKTALSANLHEAGIDYLHLRGLGTPADGRAAARAGQHAAMHTIFRAHMETDGAQEALDQLADIVRGGRRIALMCFEADHTHCHRSLVVDALRPLVAPLEVVNLVPDPDDDPDA